VCINAAVSHAQSTNYGPVVFVVGVGDWDEARRAITAKREKGMGEIIACADAQEGEHVI
jgi:hypothetical protein